MLHQGRGGALTPFLPLVAGDLSLANRIVMAPLTRSRAGTDGVPTEVMVDHYAQRSSVGLIISEGTFPSLAGKAFDGQPGLVTDAQLAGWRKVTDAVHAGGCPESSKTSCGARRTLSMPGSTVSNCTPPTVTCCTSCRRGRRRWSDEPESPVTQSPVHPGEQSGDQSSKSEQQRR